MPSEGVARGCGVEEVNLKMRHKKVAVVWTSEKKGRSESIKDGVKREIKNMERNIAKGCRSIRNRERSSIRLSNMEDDHYKSNPNHGRI